MARDLKVHVMKHVIRLMSLTEKLVRLVFFLLALQPIVGLYFAALLAGL